jgi:hypothetical protein
LSDVPELAAFERAAWGDAGASAEQLARRVATFGYGNIVGESLNGTVAAYSSFCFIDYDAFRSAGRTTWNDLSGNGTASTHIPDGPDLFGISLGTVSTAPQGLSTAMLTEVVRRGLLGRRRRGLLGARLPGYHRYANVMTAAQYAAAEESPGVPLDPGLRFYWVNEVDRG